MPRQSRKLSQDDQLQRMMGNVDPGAVEAMEALSESISTALIEGVAEMQRLQSHAESEPARVAAFRALASEADLKGLLKHAQAMKALARMGAKGDDAETALVALLRDFPEETARRALGKAFAAPERSQAAYDPDKPLDPDEPEPDEDEVDLGALRAI